MDPKLSLVTAIVKARLKETVQQQQAELRNFNEVRDCTQSNPWEEVNVDAVGHRTKPCRTEGTRPPAVRYERQCIFCGGHSHPKTDCTTTAQKSFDCGEKGHFGKVCLKRTSPSNRRKGHQATGDGKQPVSSMNSTYSTHGLK
ncbi:uncharacterized protein LOC142767980 isoform X1 [Rhipicephalus microplus]|uniref:uncharacterized protein LOC142767980 isoform X1 n=1 Tax=Rhipicephalus microplus TaxID=6941 RepID=UPI003F6ACFEA